MQGGTGGRLRPKRAEGKLLAGPGDVQAIRRTLAEPIAFAGRSRLHLRQTEIEIAAVGGQPHLTEVEMPKMAIGLLHPAGA